MTLKEKFLPKMYCFFGSGMLTNTYDENIAKQNAIECEKIADDYAIEFAEWKDKLRPSQMVSFWSKNGEFKGKFDMDNEQLLETFENGAKVMNEIFMYADFLNQPLKLEMFVPCDDNGNIYVDYKVFKNENGTICMPYEGLFEIEANKKCKGWKYLNLPQEHKEDQRYYDSISYQKAFLKYREAQEKVLFEDFEISINTIGEKVVLGDYTCLKVSDLENGTIEDLTKYVHIKLTQNSIKKLEL